MTYLVTDTTTCAELDKMLAFIVAEQARLAERFDVLLAERHVRATAE